MRTPASLAAPARGSCAVPSRRFAPNRATIARPRGAVGGPGGRGLDPPQRSKDRGSLRMCAVPFLRRAAPIRSGAPIPPIYRKRLAAPSPLAAPRMAAGGRACALNCCTECTVADMGACGGSFGQTCPCVCERPEVCVSLAIFVGGRHFSLDCGPRAIAGRPPPRMWPSRAVHAWRQNILPGGLAGGRWRASPRTRPPRASP